MDYTEKTTNLYLTLRENHMIKKHKFEPTINEKLTNG